MDQDISNESILNIIKNDIDPMLDNRISTSESRSNFLLRHIYDILNVLKSLEVDKQFSHLATLANNQWHLKIDASIDRCKEEREFYEENIEKNIWGSCEYILVAARSVSFIYTKDFKGLGADIDFKNTYLNRFYIELFHSVRSKKEYESNKLKSLIKDKLDRLHLFTLSRLSEGSEAKFWTKRGLMNILNSDVSSFVSSVIMSVIGFLIGYFFGVK